MMIYKLALSVANFMLSTTIGRAVYGFLSFVVVVFMVRQSINGYISWAILASMLVVVAGIILFTFKPKVVSKNWHKKTVWGTLFLALALAFVGDFRLPIATVGAPYLSFLPGEAGGVVENIFLILGATISSYISLDIVLGRRLSVFLGLFFKKTFRGVQSVREKNQKQSDIRSLNRMRMAASRAKEANSDISETQSFPDTKEPVTVYQQKEFTSKKSVSKTLDFGFKWQVPSLSMLSNKKTQLINEDEVVKNTIKIKEIFDSLGTEGVKVTQVVKGPLLTNYYVADEKGKKIKLTKKVLEAFSKSDLNLVQETGFVSLITTRNLIEESVSLGSIVNGVSWQSYTKEASLPVVLGSDQQGQSLWYDLAALKNVLVANGDIAERSSVLHGFALSLLLSQNPEQMRIVTMGPRNGVLVHYDNIPHVYAPHASSDLTCKHLIDVLAKDMHKRDESSVPLLVMVEELDMLLPYLDESYVEAFLRLVLLGSKRNVYVVASVANSDNPLVSGSLTAGFVSRISFRTNSHSGSMNTVNGNGAVKLFGCKDMLFIERGKARPIYANATAVALREIRAIVNFWAANSNLKTLDTLQISQIDDKKGQIFSIGGTQNVALDTQATQPLESIKTTSQNPNQNQITKQTEPKVTAEPPKPLDTKKEVLEKNVPTNALDDDDVSGFILDEKEKDQKEDLTKENLGDTTPQTKPKLRALDIIGDLITESPTPKVRPSLDSNFTEKEQNLAFVDSSKEERPYEVSALGEEVFEDALKESLESPVFAKNDSLDTTDLGTSSGLDLGTKETLAPKLETESQNGPVFKPNTPPSNTSGAELSSSLVNLPYSRHPLPETALLSDSKSRTFDQTEVEGTKRRIEKCFEQHGVGATVERVLYGPTVTSYAISPGWKETSKGRNERVRVDTILKLEKDLALELGTSNIRFEAVIHGESAIGLEVPNNSSPTIGLKSILESGEWRNFEHKAHLPVAFGISNNNEPVFGDLVKMPHLLIAGSTGSGKSVCVNTLINSLLLTRQPQEVRMVLIDPKRIELTNYQGLPHLMHPVVVEPRDAVNVLRALTKEMEQRFSILQSASKRDIASYNESNTSHRMPYIVAVVDELADLMMTSGAEVEGLLVRLAQLGRAAGIHLVVATQRPSVDVVTGLIKANFPSRICFAVMSAVDARTILDKNGGEKLLGKGDMLFAPIGKQHRRVQGVFLSDEEISLVSNHWRGFSSGALPKLVVEVQKNMEPEVSGGGTDDDDDEELINQAIQLASTQKTLSVSLLQRKLRVGYPRAARLMDVLEEQGVVGSGEIGKPRQVLSANNSI